MLDAAEYLERESKGQGEATRGGVWRSNAPFF